MQVSVESVGELGRRMTIQLPAERIDTEVDSRLKSMVGTIRLDGFRPGKVPFKVIQRRFTKQVRGEILNDTMYATFQEALTQENLKPAGAPSLEMQKNAAGEDIEYRATFEVYPDITLTDLTDTSIETPVTAISDSDVDDVLDKLRKQRVEWSPVDRAAQKGDQLTFDFDGSIDGESFAGGSAKDYQLELGSGQFISGFEDGMEGVSVGEEKTLDLKFPDDYQATELAGKAVQFAVKVNVVAEPKLPDLDDDFVAGMGISEGGVEALRTEVRDNMQREMDQNAQSIIKNRVFEILMEKNPIEVPSALLEEEVARMLEESASKVATQSQDKDALRAVFEKSAYRRVSLGLIIGEIMKQHSIQPDQDRMRQTIEKMAASYEDPASVVQHYMDTPELLQGIQGVVMEEMVVEWLLGQLQVEEKKMNFQELMETQQTNL
ncbi:MAG: trigger factor [Gammaproteobacteria bacterium]|nr:trigger factor [Gammaproteobacteria bacterium]